MINETNNKELIAALKNAEAALAKALNTITASITKYERANHPHTNFMGDPCHCGYCRLRRNLSGGYIG